LGFLKAVAGAVTKASFSTFERCASSHA
jgi:hypothetical protein